MKDYILYVQRIGLIGFTNILVALGPIIMIAILTKHYSVNEYGIWIQAYTTISLISVIATLGLPSSIVRFFAGESNVNEIKEGFYSIILLIFGVSLIMSLVFLIFFKDLSFLLFDGNDAVGIILPFIFIPASMNLLLINYFRTFQQMKKFSIFTLIQTYLNVFLAYYFVLYGYNIAYVVFGMLVTQLITFFVMLGIIVNNIGFKIPKFTNIKEYFSFGLPLLPNNLSNWVVDASGRYIIGIILGTSFVGYYTPAYSLGNIILMLVMPFSTLLLPLVSEYHDKGKKSEIKKYLNYSMKYFLILAIPCVFGLTLLSKAALTIIATAEIAQESYYITAFATVGTLFAGIYAIMLNVLLLNKKTKLIGYVWISVALLNLTLNIILIPLIGILGAAVASLISYLIVSLSSAYYYMQYNTIDFKLILKSLFASSIFSLIIILFNPQSIINIIITILVSIATYISLMIMLKAIDKKEINFFRMMIHH